MALRPSSQSSTRSSPPVTRSVSRSGFRQPLETSTPLTSRIIQPGMHIETVERVFEHADETDIMNSSKFVYREHFSVKDMTTMETEMWSATVETSGTILNCSRYDWLKYHLRVFYRKYFPTYAMLSNTIYYVTLLVMLSYFVRVVFINESKNPDSEFRLETMMAEWQKIYQSVSDIKSDLNHLKDDVDRKLGAIESQMESIEGWKESVMSQLENVQFAQSEMKSAILDVKAELDDERVKISKVISIESDAPMPTTPIPTELQMHNSFQPAIFRRPLPGVNVANSLIGASIDETCSSRTASAKDGLLYDVMSYVVSFQEGYVLLDREVLSPGEAWCTYDPRPTLTVKLARHIQPTAVSYQHVKWHGIVPNHAPKLYDLVACRSPCCSTWEPIITNCEYKSLDGHDDQEQFCTVSSTLQMAPVDHVQFRFRENHGNMKKTCAYLVRVYGEPVEVPTEQLKPVEENATADIKAEILETGSPTE